MILADATDRRDEGGELFDPVQVSGHVRGLARAVIKFAQNGARNKDFGIHEPLRNRFLPEKNAMMTLVSRRTLPAIRLDLFAAFLDGMRHGFQVRRINRTYEAHKLAARRSGGHREAARVIQNLPLLRRGQAVNLLDNLVFDRFRHNETNLGKGFRNVKGPRRTLLRNTGGSESPCSRQDSTIFLARP